MMSPQPLDIAILVYFTVHTLIFWQDMDFEARRMTIQCSLLVAFALALILLFQTTITSFIAIILLLMAALQVLRFARASAPNTGSTKQKFDLGSISVFILVGLVMLRLFL